MKAKNVPDCYVAPTLCREAVGVRIVDLQDAPLICSEVVKYEGTGDALAAAGIAPSEVFAAVGKSGKKTARFIHPDGRREVVDVARRPGGLWRVRRVHFLA